MGRGEGVSGGRVSPHSPSFPGRKSEERKSEKRKSEAEGRNGSGKERVREGPTFSDMLRGRWPTSAEAVHIGSPVCTISYHFRATSSGTVTPAKCKGSRDSRSVQCMSSTAASGFV